MIFAGSERVIMKAVLSGLHDVPDSVSNRYQCAFIDANASAVAKSGSWLSLRVYSSGAQ